VLTQIRLGILPLSIETGRYQDVPIEYRFCLYCNHNCIESEIHFLLYCDKYNDLRYDLFNVVGNNYPLIDLQEPEEQVMNLMSENVIKHTASFIYQAFQLRKLATYV
jgi:hypothetical protein